MQLLEKIVNVFQPPLNIFVESCILDVCLGSEYVSELSPTLKKNENQTVLTIRAGDILKTTKRKLHVGAIQFPSYLTTQFAQ